MTDELRRRRAEIGERERRSAVQRDSHRHRNVAIERIMDQCVPKAEHLGLVGEQTRACCLFQQADHLDLTTPCRRHEIEHPEMPSQHCGDPQQFEHFVTDHAGAAQHGQSERRHRSAVDQFDPSGVEPQRLGIGEGLDDLFDDEWIPLRTGQMPEQPVARYRTEQLLDDLGDDLWFERSEPDPVGTQRLQTAEELFDERRTRGGPAGHDKAHTALDDAGQERPQQIEPVDAEEVEILDHDDHGSFVRGRHEHVEHVDRIGERWNRRPAVLGQREREGQRVAANPHRNRSGQSGFLAEPIEDRCGIRRIGPVDGHDSQPCGTSGACHRTDQRRLADARLALEHGQRGLAARRTDDGAQETTQLRRPPAQ